MRRLLLAVTTLLVLFVTLPGRAGAVEIKTVTTPLGIKAWLVQDKSAPADPHRPRVKRFRRFSMVTSP